MKYKKLALTSLGVAGGLALFLVFSREKEKIQKEEAVTEEMRAFFSQKGEIELFYIQREDDKIGVFSGGAFLRDGRHFAFYYQEEDFEWMEVTHD